MVEEEELFDLNDYEEDNTDTNILKEIIEVEPNHTVEVPKKQIEPMIEIGAMLDDNQLQRLKKPIEHNTNKNDDNQNKDLNVNHPKYAIEDNIDISQYDKIPTYALKYPFELDDFQKRSIIRLEQHENVLACAHTSSGKTVIAEYGIAMGKNNQRRVLYTSPIKALSNQKYREFKKKFGDVGILTGDVSLNPNAQCLIMTTEILQSALYKSSELLNAVEWVVFDEIHYINDNERGHVWEEILILLPPKIGIIMLSATIPNYIEFAQWVGKIKNTTIYVQNTLKRVVPLEHSLYVDSNTRFLVKDSNDKVYNENVHEALNRVSNSNTINDGDDNKESDVKRRLVILRNKKYNNQKANMLFKLEEIILYMNKSLITPAVIFIFSIKQIKYYSKSLSHIKLIDKNQSNQIDSFFESCIKTLSNEDKQIPQVLEIREMLHSGIGIHHSGLLPLLKEIIEILYSKGLIKILLATTSFSIGLNMPTRTVVFTDIYKYNDEKREMLSSSEYLQMCGRAGRRGIDTIGNVYILLTEKNKDKEKDALIGMLNGAGTEVESKFRLSYRTIISFFSRSIKSINDFFNESFLENVTIEQIPALMKEINDIQKEINKKEKIKCNLLCDNEAIKEYMSANSELRKANMELFHWNPIQNKLKNQGRLIEVRDNEYMTNIIVLLINHYTQYNGEVWCLRVVKDSQLEPESESKTKINEHCNEVNNEGDNDNKKDQEENTYAKGHYKEYKYDYFCYTLEDIVDIYEDYLQIKIQVTDDDNYQYTGKLDLIRSIDKLIEVNTPNTPKPPLINYDKLAYSDTKILNLISKKKQLSLELSQSKCSKCKFLNEHITSYTQIESLQSKLNDKLKQINPKNMSHYKEFSLRLLILQKFDYIDENQLITLKGKAAREIATTDCLLVSEVLLSNILNKLPDEEIIAFLSCFTTNVKELDYKDPNISQSFTEAFKEFDAIYNNIINVELDENGFEDNKYNRKTSFSAAHAMNSWMKGKSFNEIVNETDLEEGKLYNLILRLYLFIEEIICFYKTLEYTALISKFNTLKQKMIRDIMAIQSLYLQESINIDIE